MAPFDSSRRDWLKAGCIACAAAGMLFRTDDAEAARLDDGSHLFNPCKSPLPERLARHELVARAWDGLDAEQVWDSHAHLLGVGDGNTGCWINPRMRSLLSPKLYFQKRFFLNAACVGDASEEARTVDADFATRLLQLMNEMRPGAKAMLFAFDRTYTAPGMFDLDSTAFYVPNAHAAKIVRANGGRFRFVASVHPYRGTDAAREIDNAVALGAVAIKWLPAAMGIDPASPLCDTMYAAVRKHNLPIITHAGEERAVEGAHRQDYGNPLRLRRPLEQGVKIVVAHCASMGRDADIDPNGKGEIKESFSLFERLMAEKRYEGLLFADISATPQINRAAYLARIVARDDWAHRLVNGSDYPLPGVMPLFSVDGLVERGWLKENEGTVIKEIRDYNPLLFDFVLKRSLRIDGRKIADRIFESGRLFART